MRNLEYKAYADDPSALLVGARELGADLWGDLRQTDTYFATPRGRLKLRETTGFQGELIFYERDEDAAHRASDYEIAHTSEPEKLRSLLEGALGVLAVVRKRRTLLVLDATRIHLDNVEGLGTFIELEVPVNAPLDEEVAQQKLDGLLADLSLGRENSIRASYLDLVLAKAAST